MNARHLLMGITAGLALGPTAEGAEGPASLQGGPQALGDSRSQLVYTPVAPCRIADTRLAGGALAPGVPRQLRVTAADLSSQGGSATGCGVPFTRATAAIINFVAVNALGAGNLRAWAYRTPLSAPPNSSVLNYASIAGSGLNLANGIAIPICDPTESGQTCAQDFLVQADGSGTHLVADVVGFFERFPVEEAAGVAVPSGTIILWDQSNECPAGYARVGGLDGRFLRGAATAGGTGGSETHAHDIAHTHGLAGHTHAGTTDANVAAGPGSGFSITGSPVSHSHTFATGGPSSNLTDGPSPATSAAGSSLPPYGDVLFCRKVDGKGEASPPRALGDSNAHLVYTPVAPCRILDTRQGGGSLPVGTPRELSATGIDLSPQGGSATGCGIPAGRATAVFVNFVAVNPTGAGNLRAWAYGTPPSPPPNSSVLNYAFVAGSGLNVANGIAIPICDRAVAGQTCPFDFRAQADGSGTHLVADVLGFFERFPVEQLEGVLLPFGSVLIWDQSGTCPAGYARADGLDGRFPRGSAAVGVTGGSETHMPTRCLTSMA